MLSPWLRKIICIRIDIPTLAREVKSFDKYHISTLKVVTWAAIRDAAVEWRLSVYRADVCYVAGWESCIRPFNWRRGCRSVLGLWHGSGMVRSSPTECQRGGGRCIFLTPSSPLSLSVRLCCFFPYVSVNSPSAWCPLALLQCRHTREPCPRLLSSPLLYLSSPVILFYSLFPILLTYSKMLMSISQIAFPLLSRMC